MKHLLCATALALTCAAMSTPARADTSAKRIALANNYAGNSWRQEMLQDWDKVGKQAVADKVVAAADFVHDLGQGDSHPGRAGAKSDPARL